MNIYSICESDIHLNKHLKNILQKGGGLKNDGYGASKLTKFN